ncbi:MAG TPA: ATP-binding protein [Chitinispirillaceae bacterium]|nr:ATP-binding protein [Chitinispirillaceae bacterium]
MKRFFKNIEIEVKILILSIVILLAFAFPFQAFYLSHLQSTIHQSTDPQLESLLITLVKSPDDTMRLDAAESLKRHRQWQALIPIFIDEQKRSVFFFSLLLFILIVLASAITVKRLTKPLRSLSVAAEEIGKGNLITIENRSGGSLGKLESAMNTMQSELAKLREKTRAQAMETAWRDIARVMAHEIKNPLTPIQLTLDRIQEKIDNETPLSNPDLSKFVNRISTQVTNLERLVNDFRSFAREPEPLLRSTGLCTILKRVTEDLEESIKTSIRGDATVMIDPRLFERVLLNLWKNSIDAGATSMNVTVENSQKQVVVTITDNGSGIPEENLQKVWVPYITFKKGGTGLGLPVVKRIIESMNGSISLASSTVKDNHYTTFTIIFHNQPHSEKIIFTEGS